MTPIEAAEAAIEAAFREGFCSPITYNDSLENDADSEWEKRKAGLLAPIAALRAALPALREVEPVARWRETGEEDPADGQEVLAAIRPYSNPDNAWLIVHAVYRDGEWFCPAEQTRLHPAGYWMPAPALPGAEPQPSSWAGDPSVQDYASTVAAPPAPAQPAQGGPLDDFGHPIVYDTEAVDNVTHALTGDEGEDDSVTVLQSLARYVDNVWPGKTAQQVLMEYEERLLAAEPAAADKRKPCTCDGAGRGPGRECVVKAGGRLGELWRCAKGCEPAAAPGAGVVEALRDGLSVCMSVSTGKDRRIVRDGCTMYAQTKEWCRWVEDEVAPKLRAALAAQADGRTE